MDKFTKIISSFGIVLAATNITNAADNPEFDETDKRINSSTLSYQRFEDSKELDENMSEGNGVCYNGSC